MGGVCGSWCNGVLLTTDPICDGVVGFVVVPLFDKDICLCSFTGVNNI